MALMQQMQMQQKGLHKLIQEFRENNADKLLGENQELQDRLFKLEMEDRSINDRGYMTMPEPKGKTYFIFSDFNIPFRST